MFPIDCSTKVNICIKKQTDEEETSIDVCKEGHNASEHGCVSDVRALRLHCTISESGCTLVWSLHTTQRPAA